MLVTGTRLKPCSYYWLHWKGPIDLEKYKPEHGTIWNWTEPTMPATAPEKFLDIYFTIIILCAPVAIHVNVWQNQYSIVK